MTIASEITRIKTNIENAYIKAEEKGATMPEVLNSENLATCIESVPKGGESSGIDIPEGYSRVRFIDMDGTILSTQILKDLEEIKDIPVLPEHENLEFYRWSWDYDLFDKKNTNPCVIGHMDIFPIYNTVDEKIYVYVDINEETGLDVEYQLCLINGSKTSNKNITYSIDFGDGTHNEYEYEKPENSTTSPTYIQLPNITHTYTNYGKYIIKIDSNGSNDTELIANYKNKCVVLGSAKLNANKASESPNRYKHPEIICIYANFIQSRFFKYLGAYLCENLETISLTAYYDSNDIDGTFWGSSSNGSIDRFENSINILNYSNIKHINVPKCNTTTSIPTYSKLESIVLDSTSSSLNYSGNKYNAIKEIVLPYLTSGHSIDNIHNDLTLYNLDKQYCLKNDAGEIIYNKMSNFINIGKINNLCMPINFTPYIGANSEVCINTRTNIINLYTHSSGSSPSLITSDTVEEVNVYNEPPLSSSSIQKGYLNSFEMSNLKRLNYNFSFEDDVDTVSVYFKNCRSLEKIDLSKPYSNAKNFRTSGYGMFEGCNSLKEIIFPQTLESIIVYGSIFKECYSLENFNYMDKLKIDDTTSAISSWFYNTKFKYIDLSNVKFSGTNALNINSLFGYASNLKHVNMFPFQYRMNGQSNFSNCKMLEEIDLTNLTEVSSSNQFSNCFSLKKVWLPSTCTTIKADTVSYALFNNIRGSSASNEELENIDFIIYTDATEKPEGWGTYWNYTNSSNQAPVYWGATKENYENNDPIPETTT